MRVGDLVKLQRGTTYAGALVGRPGPALLGLGSIDPGGGFRADHYKTFGGECPKKLMVDPGGLYVALKGATKDGSMVGSVARVPLWLSGGGRLTQDTARLDITEKGVGLESYLYWVLRTPQYRAYCAARLTGSASASFSRDDFLAYPLPVLRYSAARIVEILDLIEEKVAHEGRRAETLEVLLGLWFGALCVEPAANEVPPGWTRVSLGELIKIARGCSYRSADLAPSSTAMVTLKSFARGGGYRQEGLKAFTGRFKPNQRVLPGDVVVAVTDVTQAGEVIGRPALVRPAELFEQLVASQDVAIIRPDTPGISRMFLYFLLGSRGFVDHLRGYASGTTVLHLDVKAIPRYEFVLPPASVRSRWERLAEPVLRRMTLADLQSANLLVLRDSLLPLLHPAERSPSFLGDS